VTSKELAQHPAVVIVGGGYGGIAVAKALDETANVVLVEPKDAFMHNVAALRALVDPTWLPRIFLPYDGLLTNGRVVRDRAARVEPGLVVTASGQEITADYVVLATGSRYAFPAKTDLVDTTQAQEQIRAAHDALSQAERVLLLGAGPVGIELAGEIRAVWPDKHITLLDEGTMYSVALTCRSYGPSFGVSSKSSMSNWYSAVPCAMPRRRRRENSAPSPP
jgi:NADH dehydrogenase FAD-containing subunit